MNSKRDGHVHSHYCPHGSNDSFEEYLTKAIELGIEEITFTEHMTMPEGLVLYGIDKEFLSSAAPNIEEMKKYLKEASYYKEKYKDKNILLVTHGGTCRAINAYFNGIGENGHVQSAHIKNCEIREFEFRKN